MTWSSPTIPTDPQELIKALYAAIRAKDFAVARLYCHEDYVFTSNAHPERIGKNMHVVGPDKIAEHIAMVQRNWEILDKQPGRPKPPILEPGEPTDGSFVYNVTVHVHMRHRLSRLEFVGTKRHQWVVNRGKIAAMTEYLDVDLINTMHGLGRRPDAGGAWA